MTKATPEPRRSLGLIGSRHGRGHALIRDHPESGDHRPGNTPLRALDLLFTGALLTADSPKDHVISYGLRRAEFDLPNGGHTYFLEPPSGHSQELISQHVSEEESGLVPLRTLATPLRIRTVSLLIGVSMSATEVADERPAGSRGRPRRLSATTRQAARGWTGRTSSGVSPRPRSSACPWTPRCGWSGRCGKRSPA
ncbi:hypothetical protein [Spongiactinospora gelatinilytica]|uniref:hypothetical protein n=1 Tax=Spongiactinospora gelatinilytica TaxID=2666298 RepID=UPI0011B93496|nr:hypothetical protein [Spongiactinospora gelatinilytica]